MESELWKGPPEVPETIATDLSCQGSIASALHQTLQEIQQEEILSFDDAASSRILQSFGEAVLESRNNPDLPQGPAIRLTGRLEHFNRYQNKWRLVVDEAQLKQITRSSSKKKDPVRAEEPNLTETSNIRLEILAHNDI